MENVFKQIETTLQKNIEDVYCLMEFDDQVVEFAKTTLKRVDENLKKGKLYNPSFGLSEQMKQLERIQEHESLSPLYKMMLNQCNVLLVSFFSSAIEDLFKAGINELAALGKLEERLKEKLKKSELKMSVLELINLGNQQSSRIGDLVIQKAKISFQDMQSIKRVFDNYFSISIDQDEVVNTIIFSQAARHAIVHDSGKINEKMVKQVSKAGPRSIKKNIDDLEIIAFEKNEIKIIGKNMITYFRNVRCKIESILQA